MLLAFSYSNWHGVLDVYNDLTFQGIVYPLILVYHVKSFGNSCIGTGPLNFQQQ